MNTTVTLTKPIIDYDPLQEQIRQSLSGLDAAIEALEGLSGCLDKIYRARCIGLLKRTRTEAIFEAKDLQDLKCLIAHCNKEVQKGSERQWVLDHVPEWGDVEEHHGSWQDTYTPEAAEIETHLSPLRYLYECLAAVYHIRRSEELSFKFRTV